MNTSIDGGWHIATLGLGGNIGDPIAAMAQALRQIDERDDCTVDAVSRLYRTPPWGKIDQADFYNSCALLQTRLGPQALLERCLGIEREMKRVRQERWGPRIIDIDVLTYDDLHLVQDRLEIPHPRMLERGFVLMPLADVAGELAIKGHKVVEWLAACDVTGIEIVGDENWWRLSR